MPNDPHQLTVVVGLDEHLGYAEDSSGEVEEDVSDAPAHRRLPPEVHVSLEFKPVT